MIVLHRLMGRTGFLARPSKKMDGLGSPSYDRHQGSSDAALAKIRISKSETISRRKTKISWIVRILRNSGGCFTPCCIEFMLISTGSPSLRETGTKGKTVQIRCRAAAVIGEAPNLVPLRSLRANRGKVVRGRYEP